MGARKTGAKIEVFLLRELNKPNRLWDVIVDPARKIRVGNNYILAITTKWLLKL
jgi:S-adenosylmethionine:tRNA-ribosyltransferase-isomerase (queuine synthetase)